MYNSIIKYNQCISGFITRLKQYSLKHTYVYTVTTQGLNNTKTAIYSLIVNTVKRLVYVIYRYVDQALCLLTHLNTSRFWGSPQYIPFINLSQPTVYIHQCKFWPFRFKHTKYYGELWQIWKDSSRKSKMILRLRV